MRGPGEGPDETYLELLGMQEAADGALAGRPAVAAAAARAGEEGGGDGGAAVEEALLPAGEGERGGADVLPAADGEPGAVHERAVLEAAELDDDGGEEEVHGEEGPAAHGGDEDGGVEPAVAVHGGRHQGRPAVERHDVEGRREARGGGVELGPGGEHLPAAAAAAAAAAARPGNSAGIARPPLSGAVALSL